MVEKRAWDTHIEKAKQEAKGRMASSIDAYFERFAAAKNGKPPSIDEIEEMWGDCKREVLGILGDATNELAEAETRTVKKTAQDAAGK